MERMLETMVLVIPKGRTLRMHDAQGITMRVIAGTGWVTERGDPEDYTLGAGEERRIGSCGLTLVHAFGDTRLELSAPLGRALATVELGGSYREYAAAVWNEQLRSVASRAIAAVRRWTGTSPLAEPRISALMATKRRP